jgi:hypothetical protein
MLRISSRASYLSTKKIKIETNHKIEILIIYHNFINFLSEQGKNNINLEEF